MSFFDFDKDLGDEGDVDLGDLNAVFDSLDSQVSHASPRPVQVEAWEELSKRLEHRDIVLKLSTGSGKTTIALVYLYARMRATERPVVYLCPTRQLVRQVLTEAEHLGIPAVEYPPNQPHPGEEALEAESIVVCTYDKLFNAKTTFKRDDVNLYPSAIVMDDAHAGIQEVRDAFTLRIETKDPLYNKLHSILGPACKAYADAEWAFIGRDRDAKMEVPYWMWEDLFVAVRDEVDARASTSPFIFVWPYLRRNLRWCRCVISSTAVELVPDLAAFDLVEPFADASHRLFMSATLSDDSALVRELGCSVEAALAPIAPSKDAGVGERMVLAPTLLDTSLDREWVMQWCADLSKSCSVVVLSSSEDTAREWESFGASVELGDQMEKMVAALRDGTQRFVAFAQRYDGVDLPDRACRVLVIDGMPRGQGLVEELDHSDRKRPAGALERWVHRVEQGMGRAVRSKADYAVVILAGKDIAHFVSQKEVKDRLGAGTRAQLEMTRELTKRMKKAAAGGLSADRAIRKMAEQCLEREDAWKRYYDKVVRKSAKAAVKQLDEASIRLSAAERTAFDAACAAQVRDAAARIDAAITDHLEHDAFKGWFIQRQANYIYDADRGRAMELQRHAFNMNRKLFRPPGAVEARPVDPTRLEASKIVLHWIAKFSDANGAVLECDLVTAGLVFDVNQTKTDRFEQALADLAPMFGAKGSRPEKEFGRGRPDNLWRWPEEDWVIEAKSDRGMLPRKDSGQLHDSFQWHKDNFPERKRVPVVVSKVTEAEADANFPEGTRVITPELLKKLANNVARFVGEISRVTPLFRSAPEVQQALVRHGLHLDGFLGRYTRPLK